MIYIVNGIFGLTLYFFIRASVKLIWRLWLSKNSNARIIEKHMTTVAQVNNNVLGRVEHSQMGTADS